MSLVLRFEVQAFRLVEFLDRLIEFDREQAGEGATHIDETGV
jgi:hypothetical protein